MARPAVIGRAGLRLANHANYAVTVSNISPAVGAETGGDTVTLTGTGFRPGMRVSIGGAPCTGIVVASGTSATAVTPAGTGAGNDVVVTGPSFGPVTLPAAFEYTASGGYAAPDVSADMEDNTFGDFTNAYGSAITVVADPTPRASGKVAKFLYVGTADRELIYIHSAPIGYGETWWFTGKVYLKSGTGNYNPNHNRKLLDWHGWNEASNGPRMTLHRRDGVLRLSCVDNMDVTQEEVFADTTGIVLNDDTWYAIEVKMVTNSADNVRDGELEIYVDGEATPSFVYNAANKHGAAKAPGWISERLGLPKFGDFLVGKQLTIDGGDPSYTDERYWDDLGIGNARMGVL